MYLYALGKLKFDSLPRTRQCVDQASIIGGGGGGGGGRGSECCEEERHYSLGCPFTLIFCMPVGGILPTTTTNTTKNIAIANSSSLQNRTMPVVLAAVAAAAMFACFYSDLHIREFKYFCALLRFAISLR